jgi:hypothetical protein
LLPDDNLLLELLIFFDIILTRTLFIFGCLLSQLDLFLALHYLPFDLIDLIMVTLLNIAPFE